MLSKKLTVDKIPHMIKNKRVLVRVDFNVPIKDGKVADPTRIVSTLDTINFLKENGAKSIVLMSHLGRPKGVRQEQFSLAPVVPALEDIIGQKVNFLNDCIGTEVEGEVANTKDGNILLLENLRFYLEEEGKGVINGEKVKADPTKVESFRSQLTRLGDLYVNDAFGTCHRAHSSMVGVNVDTRAAGFLLKKELDYFSKVLEDPKRPLTVILGGAKVADKIQLINNLLDLADEMIIGGGMAFTFNKVLNNTPIGASLYDEEGAKTVHGIMEKAKEKGVKIHIPSDFVCAESFAEDAKFAYKLKMKESQDGWLGLDIGDKTIRSFDEVIRRSNTLFWNGPSGVFEWKNFAKGSHAMLQAVTESTKNGTVSVCGGGDTLNLLKQVDGAKENISHVSTGGGASLELVEGKELPGIKALSDIN
uniref:Phosphoglycerate kinase n=1 Tax=Euplotes crassus TaxID=5936 RepID=PGK_EUPCR|nr:RecName: Full=Phosphoglycerate kinase [Moneuplotes crassus]AAB58162.1 phosphoglycerate kinase [Moneuplotes crassus]